MFTERQPFAHIKYPTPQSLVCPSEIHSGLTETQDTRAPTIPVFPHPKHHGPRNQPPFSTYLLSHWPTLDPRSPLHGDKTCCQKEKQTCFICVGDKLKSNIKKEGEVRTKHHDYVGAIQFEKRIIETTFLEAGPEGSTRSDEEMLQCIRNMLLSRVWWEKSYIWLFA